MDSVSVHHSAKRHPARPGFPDLPNEIIVPILKQLSPDQLLGLAFLSRRLHLLALPIYLQHIGVIADYTKPSSCDINVYPWAFSTVLPLLQKSFFIESISNLGCMFPSSDSGLLHEVLSLSRFVSRMVAVDAVSLCFGWEESPSPASVKAWTTAFAVLLRLFARKSCTSISVKYIGYSADAFVGKDLAKARKDKSSFIQRLLNLLRGTKALMERAPKASVILPLAALNHSGITHLSLDNLNLSCEDWTAILRNTTLPSLTYLSLIPTYASAGFLDFLLRHPSITAVNIQLHNDFGNRFLPPTKGLLPNLITIDANIGTLEYFSRTELTSLETVNASVKINYPNFRADLRDIGRVFAHLMFNNGCALCLVVRMEFDDWYVIDDDYGEIVEGWQGLVKIVLINTNAGDDDLRALHKRKIIARWLGEELPNVEEVQIGREEYWMDPGDRAVFDRAIRKACRCVKGVSIHGESLT